VTGSAVTIGSPDYPKERTEMDAIEATITVTITHVAGPVVADPDQVRRWIVSDSQFFEGRACGFEFDVCSEPGCVDPDACFDHDETSIYNATVCAVSWDSEEAS
jgi:hypothetical protein